MPVRTFIDSLIHRFALDDMANTILDKIVAYKRDFLADCMARMSFEEMTRLAENAPPVPSLFEGLRDAGDIAIVAEVKKASPSKGIIRADFDALGIAKIYAENGAAALSVLTDEKFFGGSADDLTRISRAVDRPILRKDFAIDPYQICEARALGASAVLLIVAILTPGELASFLVTSRALGLDALVEVHDRRELAVALDAGAEIIGINNRNLKTFETSLDATYELIPHIPEGILKISESGIHTREDVASVKNAGADAVLVGECLMRASDIGAKLRELRGYGTG